MLSSAMQWAASMLLIKLLLIIQMCSSPSCLQKRWAIWAMCTQSPRCLQKRWDHSETLPLEWIQRASLVTIGRTRSRKLALALEPAGRAQPLNQLPYTSSSTWHSTNDGSDTLVIAADDPLQKPNVRYIVGVFANGASTAYTLTYSMASEAIA